MASHTALQDCPIEIIHEFFDGLTLADLVCAMLVCRRWATIAIDHHTYWSNISLTDEGMLTKSSHLFLNRLGRAYSRPTIVSVTVSDPRAVLPCIRAHLGHIVRLTFGSSLEHGSIILSTLCSAAPLLEHFSIELQDPDRGPPRDNTLPTVGQDIFCAHAPLLKSIVLWNVAFPEEGADAFAAVAALELANTQTPAPHLPNIFATCTKLRTLKLTGQMPVPHPSFMDPGSWTRISLMVFTGGPISRQWYRLGLPLVGLDRVQLVYPDYHGAAALMQQLDGRLDVGFNRLEPGARTFLEATVTAVACDRRIRVMHSGVQLAIRGIFSHARRISRLTLPCAAFVALGFDTLPALPALTELCLCLTAEEVCARASGIRVVCPACGK